MNVVIIDYGAGNIQSLQFGLARLNVKGVLSRDPELIQKADRVIFPGVGQARSAWDKLTDSGLQQLIPELEQPVLGICLGMQLMCEHTEEGDTPGLGIFPLEVKRFQEPLKVPQIGWNRLENLQPSIFQGLKEDYVYLVHSYYAPLSTYTIGECYYGSTYSAALRRENFFGCQFHPEKSGPYGQKILENFIFNDYTTPIQ